MIIFTEHLTPRVRYMADFTGMYFTGHPAQLTNDKDEFARSNLPAINYSQHRLPVPGLWIMPHTLLFEEGTWPQETTCFPWQDTKAFFKTAGDWPFDIFAAVFYLLSRYEEYLPHQKDIYGRYAYENSLAWKEGFLDKPLVNIWLMHLGNMLKTLYPGFVFRKQAFHFQPTYDIDEAYCYKHKVWWRSAGAAARDLLTGKWKSFTQRRRVLNNQETDPFDSYEQLDNLHRPYKIKPVYFFLVAAKAGRYDKNILPGEPAMQRLIKSHADKYTVGIHPSWQSGDDRQLLQREKEVLERITQTKTGCSRQHFIRFTLPETFSALVKAGIKEDYSMGYGSINGFRASVAVPFYWYDLQKEQTTPLLLHPFCFMEANSYYEQHFSPEKAVEEMMHYYRQVRKVNGTLITIWHNTFLGTANKFKGWKEAWFSFFHQVMKEERENAPY